MSTSIIDYIFRELAINYLGRDDLAQVVEDDLRGDSVKQDPECLDEVSPDEHELAAADISTDLFPARKRPGNGNKNGHGNGNSSVRQVLEIAQKTVTSTELRVARMKGYEGDPCPTCRRFTMVRTGTCLRCDSCGEANAGCS